MVPAVAALPFSARVSLVDKKVSKEGIWALSRMPISAGDSSSGSLGSGTSYGKTFVSSYEYGEVLLLDPNGRRILRAFPLPGLPPQRLLVTPSATYCQRQGDGALGDSMLCRIDRKSLKARVRVFPSVTDSGFSPQQPDRYLPPNWTINEPIGRAMFQAMQDDGRALIVKGEGVTGRINPVTLMIQNVR